MRRFKQQLSEEESEEILRHTTSGVLCLCCDNLMPYGVPLSHVYEGRKLYFHSALAGHKLDLIRQNANACFTVIMMDEIHPEKYTTYYQSVMAFGKIRIIEDNIEKRHILELLGHRCNQNDEEGLAKEIESGINRCHVLEMNVENLMGKQAIELLKHP